MIFSRKATSFVSKLRALLASGALLAFLAPMGCLTTAATEAEEDDNLAVSRQEVAIAAQNLALGRPTSQSSTYPLASAVSSSAVDGNTDGNFGNGSVSHTNYEAAWWQVDLQSVQSIGNAVVWNRTDCCSQRLSNFSLQVSNDGVTWQSYGFSGAAPGKVSFGVNRAARYVRVKLDGANYLSLAEVQVFSAVPVMGPARCNDRVRLKSWKNDYLNRPDSPQGVTTDSTGATLGNEWTVECQSDGSIQLRSWKGDYLNRPNGAAGVTTSTQGKWTVIPTSGAKVVLGSSSGDYLNRPNSLQGVTTSTQDEWTVEKPTRVLNVVAHQDDDLLFLNPDIQNDIALGSDVQTIVLVGPYWSAGPAAQCDNCPEPYERRRELGSKAAYATMAGEANPVWIEQRQQVAGKTVYRHDLARSADGGAVKDPKVSAVYLRLGNSTMSPINTDSQLVELWGGSVPSVMSRNLADPPQKTDDYTRDDVIAVIAGLIAEFNPDRVRLGDSSGNYGMDHEEHTVTSRFARAALRRFSPSIPYTQYRGYNITGEVANMSSPGDVAGKHAAFAAYGTWDLTFSCANAGSDPSSWCNGGGEYGGWISRQYKVPDADASYWSTLYRPYINMSLGKQFSDSDTGHGSIHPETFRLADVNGDGFPDACMRWGDGIYCAQNLGGTLFSSYALYGAGFSDAQGWGLPSSGSTIQLADLNHDGKADVCGRDSGGVQCALANASGTGFSAPSRWTIDFSDSQGWAGQASYYGSIRLVDVNGDGYADLCGRGYIGILCELNNTAGGFNGAYWATTDAFDNSGGWDDASFGTTIQFGDVNGDHKMDVCGRGPAGILCELGTGTGYFQGPFLGSTNFTTSAGWTADYYYGSIRLADVNGDGKADVCGRGVAGILCGISQGNGFSTPTLWNSTFSDAASWNATAYGPNIQFADLNKDGHIDVCGRGGFGLLCATSP